VSKKRILSNGYSSYYKDDIVKPKKEKFTEAQRILRNAFSKSNVKKNAERDLILYMGRSSMEAFDKAMKEELIKQRLI